MSLVNAFAGLADVLTQDADLITWATAAGGSFSVLKVNREPQQLRPSELPALIIELGDGQIGEPVGGHHQIANPAAECSIVFEQKNFDLAFDLRTQLPELVTQALLRKSSLNGAVRQCWLTGWSSDLGFFYPRHTLSFSVHLQISISR